MKLAAPLAALGCAVVAAWIGYGAALFVLHASGATELVVTSRVELVAVRLETAAALALPFVYGWALAAAGARSVRSVRVAPTLAAGAVLAAMAALLCAGRVATWRAMYDEASQSGVQPMFRALDVDAPRLALGGVTALAVIGVVMLLRRPRAATARSQGSAAG